jgi:exopolysaccharide biosynthesis WecB/TagA/CpsF family protein
MDDAATWPEAQSAGPRRPAIAARRPSFFEVDSWGINVADMDEAIAAILERLEDRESFLVCTLNLDHLVKLRRDSAFRKAYRRAEIVTADGFPIVLAGRWQGANVVRTTGADLIDPLCREAAQRSVPVFLFGSSPDALFRSARVLHTRYPELDIRGVTSPPHGFEVTSSEADEAIRQVRESGARICFVALGAPKQEVFALHAMEQLDGVAFVGVGGGLDFIANVQRRAPVLVRRLNLEWFWRLASDPRRMAHRYWSCGILFAGLAARMAWSRVRAPAGRSSR